MNLINANIKMSLNFFVVFKKIKEIFEEISYKIAVFEVKGGFYLI